MARTEGDDARGAAAEPGPSLALVALPQDDAELRRLRAAAHQLLAAIYERRGNAAAAAAERQRAEQVAASNRAEAERALRQARALVRAGSMEQARKRLANAIELDPTLAAAWFERGLLHLQMLRLGEAALDIAQALELEPAYADRYFEQLEFGRMALDLEPLRRELEQQLEAQPDEPRLLALLGFYPVARAYIFGERDPAAIATGRARLDRALLLHPRFALARVGRAYLRLLQGEADAALADLDAAERHHGGFVLASYMRAIVCAQRGDVEAALAALRRARRLGLRDGSRLERDPALAPLRDDPRFRAMLEQWGS
ncbi:MAG: hypothetical protein KatS3mg102_2184 [Planctomycetota bacterium]|nr:MAG: hypothetical protein KatS3mg102_2184 [Planctomycetota bacterium]